MDISTINSADSAAALPLLREALTTITRFDLSHLLCAQHVGTKLEMLKPTKGKKPAGRSKDRHPTNLHDHVWHEICVPLAGECAMETAAGVYALDAPCMAVCSPGMLHCERRISQNSTHAALWFSFGKAYVISMLSIYKPVEHWATPLRWQTTGRLATQVTAALSVFDGKRESLNSHVKLEAFRLALLALASDVYRQAMIGSPKPADKNSLGHHHVQLLKQLALFIEQHLDQPIRLEQLASIAHLSPNHLNTLFRRWTGQPMHAWIVTKRMEKAMKRLLQPGVLAKQVAIEVGYDDPLYFSRAFHKHFGFWPSQAKEQTLGL